MDNRTKGIIATVASAVVCGCVGLFACIFGVLGAFQVPFQTDVNGVTGNAPMPSTWGYALICLSVILLAVPVVVGFLTLRKKAAAPDMAGPMPPAA
jgi:hypothetical protein